MLGTCTHMWDLPRVGLEPTMLASTQWVRKGGAILVPGCLLLHLTVSSWAPQVCLSHHSVRHSNIQKGTHKTRCAPEENCTSRPSRAARRRRTAPWILYEKAHMGINERELQPGTEPCRAWACRKALASQFNTPFLSCCVSSSKGGSREMNGVGNRGGADDRTPCHVR